MKRSGKDDVVEANRSCIWYTGLGAFMIANCVHAAVIPYLDLVLLSTSVSYNIIFAILIGVMLGGEKF